VKNGLFRAIPAEIERLAYISTSFAANQGWCKRSGCGYIYFDICSIPGKI
jgi:hypothetical protein